VADVSLSSRVQDANHAWAVHTQPGQAIPLPIPASRARGTTVVVRNLFATVPARRQFLRRATTESLVIQQLLRGLAFCVPAVGFSLDFDERRQWQAVAARDERSAAQRWRSVFGAEFARDAQFIERMAGDMRVYGWVGPPELARAQADLQFLAVNGRLVRDRQLVHGIRMAFADALPAGRYASFALHLELPPSEVDVNVHPGKTEVRFRHLREVHDLFFSAARQALAGVPSAIHTAVTESAVRPAVAAQPGLPARGVSFPTQARFADAPTVPEPLAAQMQIQDRAEQPWPKPALLGGRYLPVVEYGGALRIHDVVALIEAALEIQTPLPRQVLTFPIRVPTPPGPTAGLALAELSRFELEFAAIGPTTWVLRAFPGWLPAVDGEAFVRALLQDRDFPGDSHPAVARALAGALEVPPAVDARGAWLEAWTQHLRGLDPAAFSCTPSADAVAALFPRPRRER